MTLKVRPMTEEEQGLIERLAHTRTAPAGTVRRAQNEFRSLQLALG